MESQDAKDEGEEDRSVPASSKKADKKAARGLAILKRDTGLGESEDVTSNIFVCNAGLVTGCSSSGMFNVFSLLYYFRLDFFYFYSLTKLFI